MISSFWILAVNSWMQTPRGHRILPDGRFEVVSFFDVIFTPSFPYRLGHTVSAFLVTAAFVILGVGAMYVRQRRALEESRVMLKMSLIFLVIMVPVQMVIGDMHGLNTLKHQPVKIAAMEGLWETGSRVPAESLRDPRPGGRDEPLRDRDSRARQHLPDARSERHGAGPQGVPARGPADRRGGVLRVPDHGRHRVPDVRCWCCPASCCSRADGSKQSRTGCVARRSACRSGSSR